MSNLEQPFLTTAAAIHAANESLSNSEAQIELNKRSIAGNGLQGIRNKITKIVNNSPVGTLLTTITFGDSLRDRVAGYIHRELLRQYNYGNPCQCLDASANPEVSTGAYSSITVTLAGGAAFVAAGTDYSIWPTGAYLNMPNGSTAVIGGTSNTTYRHAWYYLVESGGGAFELETSPDNSTWTSRGSFSASGSTAGAVAAYSATSTNFSRIRVTSGSVKILGNSMRRTSARGVMTGAIGVAGLSIANAALTSSAVMVPILTDLSPDMVSIHMDDDATLMQANLPTVLSWFTAANAKCCVLLIGNGPKTGFETEMVAQNAYYRSLSYGNPGYAFVDGMQLLRSVAYMTTMGWINDGVHLDDSAWAVLAITACAELDPFGQILFGRLTRPLIRYDTSASVSVRQIDIGRDETTTIPALILKTDASFGLDTSLLISRALSFTNTAGSTNLFRISNNEATFTNLGFSRAYIPNMTGALGSPYTGPSVGGVLYVESDTIKWRNAANSGVTDLTSPPALQVVNVPSGSISATNVQSAINELDSEKAALTGAALNGDFTWAGTGDIGPVIRASDGSRWRISVSTLGVLSTTSV